MWKWDSFSWWKLLAPWRGRPSRIKQDLPIDLLGNQGLQSWNSHNKRFLSARKAKVPLARPLYCTTCCSVPLQIQRKLNRGASKSSHSRISQKVWRPEIFRSRIKKDLCARLVQSSPEWVDEKYSLQVFTWVVCWEKVEHRSPVRMAASNCADKVHFDKVCCLTSDLPKSLSDLNEFGSITLCLRLTAIECFYLVRNFGQSKAIYCKNRFQRPEQS